MMNQEQIKKLTKMKKLIRQGKRRFKMRIDRDHVEDLSYLGLNEEEAWYHILTLNTNLYIPDSKPAYHNGGSALLFKKNINNKIAYIKIDIEENEDTEEAVVCWSFHADRR